MSLVETVYASQTPVDTSVYNPVSSITNIGQIFAVVLNLILGIGWALVFIMLAMGFVQYILSKGEKTAVENAQKWLTYAVIGGVGLFFVYILRTIIPQLFSADTRGPASWLQF